MLLVQVCSMACAVGADPGIKKKEGGGGGGATTY